MHNQQKTYIFLLEEILLDYNLLLISTLFQKYNLHSNKIYLFNFTIPKPYNFFTHFTCDNKSFYFYNIPITLISLILDEETITENASTHAETEATNLAQLLRFNAVKTKRRCDGFLKDSKLNESPLLVKTGLLVHAKTKKKLLVEQMAAEGLSISYLRVQDNQKMVTNQ